MIAAIMIVLAVSGIASVATYAVVKSQPKNIYDFAEDLERETAYITDYGVMAEEDVNSLLSELTTEQFAEMFLAETDNASSIFVFGDKNSISVVQIYEDDAGAIETDLLDPNDPRFHEVTEITIPVEGVVIEKTNIPITPGRDYVDVTILGKQYRFEINNGEMFYFVIVEAREGEIYVAQN